MTMTTKQWATIARERLTPLLGAPPDVDFVDEVAAHLAQAYEEARRDGLSDEEGRAAALRLLEQSSPWVDAARERARRPIARRLDDWTREEALGTALSRDIRHACRMLLRAPVFSLLAILTF